MKKIITFIFVFLFFVPNLVMADSSTRDMVRLTLIDKETGEEASGIYGPGYVEGNVKVRCYGYEWSENGYGMGFDQEEPEDYVPEEVYTISEYYKGDYSLMDWTHYIKFKTIEYCDFELESTEGEKFVSKKYNDWPVIEDNCKLVATNENYETFYIDRVCKMELEVEKVEKFGWETDSLDEKEECAPTSCVVEDAIEKNIETNINNKMMNENHSWWSIIVNLIARLFGGDCR